MAEHSDIEQFKKAFVDLKGGHLPFPWQERLFTAFADNQIPDCLDIPTGLGKTSVIEIWLLAHLLSSGSKPPTRLIYVVNRRTIVDQATAIAESLKEKIAGSQACQKQFGRDGLAVSALRGALADNREWMQRPHRPAIIIGTVDMIGSRLLFDAYRAGKWTRAMHAGLLGQDSLIVHDEAHLSQPFQKLLEWIQQRQRSDHSPRPIHVMAMSATGNRDDYDCKITMELDETDRSLDAVDKRINSKKRLKIQSCEKSNLAEMLSELAAKYEGEGESARRVIVYVTTPAVAKKVSDALRKKLKDAHDRIELLTGTIRGHERDLLVNTPTLCHLLKSTRPPKTVYLISTSAGEVGADFDADHLVCDIAPLDSMIQRLGRVNRRGDGDARVDVLVEIKDGGKISDLDRRRLNTRDWLGKLPQITGDSEGRLNASPSALKTLRESDPADYLAAISEPPTPVLPHDVTLDAWAMTSIQDSWPLAQKLDEYLHGMAKYEPSRTSIAWRDEGSIFFPSRHNAEAENYDPVERASQFENWIEACPLHPREMVSSKSEDVMDLLQSRAKKHPDCTFVRFERRKICVERLDVFVANYEQLDKIAQQRYCKSLGDQTFILPSEVGGLDAAGMIDPGAEGPVIDVADGSEVQTGDPAIDCQDRTPHRDSTAVAFERSRAVIRIDEEGALSWNRLGTAKHDSSAVGAPSDPGSWTQWRDQIGRGEQNRKCRLAIRLKGTDRMTGVLVLFKLPFKKDAGDSEVELTAHLEKAGKFAECIGALLPDELEAGALKLAALWHDLGKDRRKWQASIYNLDSSKTFAKSFGKGMNPAELGGYRHEFGSLIDVTNAENKFHDEFDTLKSEKELLLHLIATHHGRGRPFFPEGDFDPDNPISKYFGELITPAAIAQRYAQLQRKYGHWGLAWYESLLMCADQAASRGDEPEDVS